MTSLPLLLQNALGAMDHLPVTVATTQETLQSLAIVSEAIEMPPSSYPSPTLARAVQHLSGLIAQASSAGPRFGPIYERLSGQPFGSCVNQFYSAYASGTATQHECDSLSIDVRAALQALQERAQTKLINILPEVCTSSGSLEACSSEYIEQVKQRRNDLNIQLQLQNCQLLNLRNLLETHTKIISLCESQLERYKGCQETECVPCIDGVPTVTETGNDACVAPCVDTCAPPCVDTCAAPAVCY